MPVWNNSKYKWPWVSVDSHLLLIVKITCDPVIYTLKSSEDLISRKYCFRSSRLPYIHHTDPTVGRNEWGLLIKNLFVLHVYNILYIIKESEWEWTFCSIIRIKGFFFVLLVEVFSCLCRCNMKQNPWSPLHETAGELSCAISHKYFGSSQWYFTSGSGLLSLRGRYQMRFNCQLKSKIQGCWSSLW